MTEREDRMIEYEKIAEILAEIRDLAGREPQRLTRAEILRIQERASFLHYLLQGRGPAQIAEAQVFFPERCSICSASIPLWFIRGSWVCLEHIPKEITFPLALWGEEWLKSGRKAPKRRDDR